MKLINRLMISYIIRSTLVVSLVFLGINLFIAFAGELPSIGQGNYGLWQAFCFIAMELPYNLYQMFPMAALLGTLLGMGQLASTSELVVMRAAGVSILQMAWAMVQAAIIMMIVMLAVGEWLAPKALNYANYYKNRALGHVVSNKDWYNVWLKAGHDFVHIDRVVTNNRLQGVTWFHYDGLTLRHIYQAKQVVQVDNAWQMLQVHDLHFLPNHISSTAIQQLKYPYYIAPDLLYRQDIDPSALNLVTLWHSISYRAKVGLTFHHLSYAFWQRIAMSITTLVMMLLGLPFVFGSQREKTAGQRVVIGVLMGFGFYMLNQVLGLFTMVLPINSLLAALGPTIIFGVIAFVSISKVR